MTFGKVHGYCKVRNFRLWLRVEDEKWMFLPNLLDRAMEFKPCQATLQQPYGKVLYNYYLRFIRTTMRMAKELALHSL